MDADGDLSCTAKLVHLVLAERGPLAPPEVAEEARLSEPEVREGLEELVDRDIAEAVCGVAETGEEVFALTDAAPTPDHSA